MPGVHAPQPCKAAATAAAVHESLFMSTHMLYVLRSLEESGGWVLHAKVAKLNSSSTEHQLQNCNCIALAEATCGLNAGMTPRKLLSVDANP